MYNSLPIANFVAVRNHAQRNNNSFENGRANATEKLSGGGGHALCFPSTIANEGLIFCILQQPEKRGGKGSDDKPSKKFKDSTGKAKDVTSKVKGKGQVSAQG